MRGILLVVPTCLAVSSAMPAVATQNQSPAKFGHI